ncbi:hypothetical protein V8G54_029911 [Vigna mungo]|uniref:Bifunctional inhibitor/plant lipid transfer protein/seed storage helical domain-containing protein n=1 Tax=Vigna mungo TaxID=3915 RepID=A0AAQ3MV82_VIGMU
MKLSIPMAQGRMKMGVVLVMMSMMCAGAAALSSTCASVLLSLSPCLNYIDGNSSTPSSSCCLQFANVELEPQPCPPQRCPPQIMIMVRPLQIPSSFLFLCCFWFWHQHVFQHLSH